MYQSKASGDWIIGNYIDGVKRPIYRSPQGGNTQLLITDNVINHRNYEPGVSPPPAISLLSSGAQSELVWNNIVTGDSDGAVIAVTPNHNVGYINNICNVDISRFERSECRDASRSVHPWLITAWPKGLPVGGEPPGTPGSARPLDFRA